jgi:hypothetical protein
MKNNEIRKEGYDVWTIEMTGGPQIECSDCPDYTYQDLVDYFWPALVAGAMEYSGKNKVDYVGHSNGCRVALSSLNSYSNGKNNAGYVFNSQTGQYDTLVDLPNLPVNKFFGIGCPGTLNDDTEFTKLARINGNSAMQKLSNKQHMTLGNYFDKLTPLPMSHIDKLIKSGVLRLAFGNTKISYNLMDFYNDLAVNESSSFDVNNVNVAKLYLHHGLSTDLIVHFEDSSRIIDSSSLHQQDKENVPYSTLLGSENHALIKNNRAVKEDIKKRLR